MMRCDCISGTLLAGCVVVGLIVVPSPIIARNTATAAIAPASEPVNSEALELLRKGRSRASEWDSLYWVADAYAKAGDVGTARSLLREAAESVGGENLADLRCDQLTRISDAQVRVGDSEGARLTLDAALPSARAGDVKFQRAEALAKVAAAMARAGLPQVDQTFAEAKAAADRNQGTRRDSQYQRICAAMTEADRVARAQTLAGEIPGGLPRDLALQQIVKRLAERGRVAEAKSVAKQMSAAVYGDGALQSIAEAQARAGDVAGFYKTLDGIQVDLYAESALAVMAECQAKSRNSDAALQTAQRIASIPAKLRAYEAICLAQSDQRRDADARATAGQMRELAARVRLEMDGWQARSVAMRRTGAALARVGEQGPARECFAKALNAAKKGDDEDAFGGVSKWNNFRDLAIGEAGAGQFEAACAAIEAIPAGWPQRREACRMVAQACAASSDRSALLHWIDTLQPEEAAEALAGAAEGIMDKGGYAPEGRGVR